MARLTAHIWAWFVTAWRTRYSTLFWWEWIIWQHAVMAWLVWIDFACYIISLAFGPGQIFLTSFLTADIGFCMIAAAIYFNPDKLVDAAPHRQRLGAPQSSHPNPPRATRKEG